MKNKKDKWAFKTTTFNLWWYSYNKLTAKKLFENFR